MQRRYEVKNSRWRSRPEFWLLLLVLAGALVVGMVAVSVPREARVASLGGSSGVVAARTEGSSGVVSQGDAAAGGTAMTGKAYTWFSGKARKKSYMSDGELAIFFRPGAAVSPTRRAQLLAKLGAGATLAEDSSDFVMFVRTTDAAGKATRLAKSLKQEPEVAEVSPVFWSDADGRSGKSAPTGEVIVAFRDDGASGSARRTAVTPRRFAAASGMGLVKKISFAANTYLFKSSSALGSVVAANNARQADGVAYATPNWLRPMSKRAVPDDTYYAYQWHLKNTGQGTGTPGEDINVQNVWDTYRGSTNEVIAIVDDGLEIGHEDLATNTASGGHWDWLGGDSNPSPTGPVGPNEDNHGTSVAGLAAGRGFNGKGVTGAAPYARLVGYRLLGADTDANTAEALTRNGNVVDISSNSWGPYDDRHLEAPGIAVESAIENGAVAGRGGKGTVYVWAGGNGLELGDDSNFDGYANSRYTIGVAASTNQGEQAPYSETGANLHVTAPSDGVWTTDRTGAYGYDAASNYTSDFNGTSAAAPIASGVSALMLQANPDLGWRDVQQVLMRTAAKNDSTDSDWTTNGAGYHINHKYGYGRVDAAAAVSVAETWTPVGEEESASASAAPGLPIPDNNSTGVSDTVTIAEDLNVEYVDVWFSAADHLFWEDLEVSLISPSGTKSVLAPVPDNPVGTGSVYDNWRFGSARHLGESSEGDWKLTVKDLAEVDTGTFQSWTIKVYGTSRTLSGTFGIDNNASYATTVAVSLDSTIAGAVDMRYRDEGGIWTDWETYSKNKAWTLPSGDGTKTVEAEYRNASLDVMALTDSIKLDTSVPSGTFVIDEGAAQAATSTVSLDSTVTGADEMRFRNAGGSWSVWTGYAAHQSWTLPTPDGTKTIEAEFRDYAGNKIAASDAIRLETGPPGAPSNMVAARGDQLIDLTWQNPTGDFVTVRVLRSAIGYPATQTPSGDETTVAEGSVEATSDTSLTNGTRYYYSAFAQDEAGDWSVPATASAVPAAPTTLTVGGTKASNNYGTGVTVFGTLKSGATTLTGARTTVQLWKSTNGTTWSQDGTAAWNGSTGRYQAARNIYSKTYYQLRYTAGGEPEYQEATSTNVVLTCRAYLGKPWLVPYSPTRWSNLYVYGYLKPRHTGSTRLYFYRYYARKWRYFGYRNATNVNYKTYTRYQLKWRLPYRGWWRVKAYHADAGHLTTYSLPRTFWVK